MHYADIIAALIKVNCSLSSVAADLKVSPSAVSQVIRGDRTSRKIARHISEKIQFPVSKLWPGKYPALELAEIRGTRKAA